MAKSSSEIVYIPVPEMGPLRLGAVYRRAHLHDRFQGKRYTGISKSSREPVVMLFHTEEPSQQFYEDGFDADGLYWYSGEGTVGDMSWTSANKAIRDHAADGRDLFLFERVQRKNGLWRFSHVVRYFDHRVEERPDKEGNPRKAIIFALLADEAAEPFSAATSTVTSSLDKQAELRKTLANLDQSQTGEVKERIQRVYKRSGLVAQYARMRANGICEACLTQAPFLTPSGEPFLEIHHIDRVADGGADRFDRVAAICPNCHRRCHHAADSKEYNKKIGDHIATLEMDKEPEGEPLFDPRRGLL